MARSSKRTSHVVDQQPREWSAPGVVSLQELYTVEEAKARMGWTESAFRSAKRQGLKLLMCGKRRYVTGTEILRFLASLTDKMNHV
jgi:hypothetical protein